MTKTSTTGAATVELLLGYCLLIALAALAADLATTPCHLCEPDTGVCCPVLGELSCVLPPLDAVSGDVVCTQPLGSEIQDFVSAMQNVSKGLVAPKYDGQAVCAVWEWHRGADGGPTTKPPSRSE
ncbi:hypothetical protein NDU88_002532 [Pleurodeles waltl]|uniref:IGFBP N-terminal domain-containing protein n=1 Tax=Pleurodeles waltl TaxID=8319 RepID=A0AAV7KVN9_PLEWA|nr:hypothetical protein NDU88_002532 [Pleurodeles waltl]